jgi:hypothetical protein
MTASPRIFDLPRAQLAALAGSALEASVRASEGRAMVSEVFAAAPGLVDGIHNAELMAAHGADVIVLNLVEGAWSDSGTWSFPSLGTQTDLTALAATIGRPIGVNLEPTHMVAGSRLSVGRHRQTRLPCVMQGQPYSC